MIDSNDAVPNTIETTILALPSKLNNKNYRQLIAYSEGMYKSGVRELLLDFEAVDELALSGMFALFAIARLYLGMGVPKTYAGWHPAYTIADEMAAGRLSSVQLLNVSSEIRTILEQNKFIPFFTVESKTAVLTTRRHIRHASFDIAIRTTRPPKSAKKITDRLNLPRTFFNKPAIS